MYLCTFFLFLWLQIFLCQWLRVICIHCALTKGCHSYKVGNSTKATFKETIQNQILIDLCLTTLYLKMNIWEEILLLYIRRKEKWIALSICKAVFFINCEIFWYFMHLSLCSVIVVLFPDNMFSRIKRPVRSWANESKKFLNNTCVKWLLHKPVSQWRPQE